VRSGNLELSAINSRRTSKITTLQSYQSREFSPYISASFNRPFGHVRGIQGNNRYAEAFDLMRLIAS
jgi:hypothetical protein